jgi:hypothetical protein
MPERFSRVESIQIVGKVLYILSSFELSLNQPAPPSFLNNLGEQIGLSIGTDHYLDSILNSHLKLTCKTGLLQSSTTLADEILFYCAHLKKNDKSRAQITKLFHHLKAQQGAESSLWQTLLNTYLIEFLSDDKEVSCVNLTKFLRELFGQLAPNVTIEEKQQLITQFIVFAADIMFQWGKHREQNTAKARSLGIKSYAMQSKINYFAAFSAELMNAIPEPIILPQESYFYLATLLFRQLPQFTDGTDKEIIKGTMENFLSYYQDNINQRELTAQILAQLMALMVMTTPQRSRVNAEFLNLVSAIEPTWIRYISNEFSLNGKAHNILSILVRQLSDKGQGIAEHSARIISYLLSQLIDQKEIRLPLDFLSAVADWKHDLQKKTTLSAGTQELLETIYNQCIHKVQGTEQEQGFEEIRTQLLLKFDADPTKDTQAIHTRENHQFADRILEAWNQALGETNEQTQKLKQGLATFATYLQKEKDKKVSSLLANMNEDKLRGYLHFIYGQEMPGVQDFKCIADQINSYAKVEKYLADLRIRGNRLTKPEMQPVERNAIVDARKLHGIIAMAVYYATSEQSPNAPFTLQKSAEVLNILFLELLDQAEHPSCDQGPFIRILMALEPVAEYKFPYLTRRTIHFYTKEYINYYYDQLPQEEKNNLIGSIYEKIEDKDNLDKVDSIPEDTLTFLAARFIKEKEGRIGFITHKEIEYLFFMERPEEYHPKIVEALNQHHQEQKKNRLIPTTYNPNRFFMNSSVDHIPAPMELNAFLEQPPVNDDNDDLMDLDAF